MQQADGGRGDVLIEDLYVRAEKVRSYWCV